MRETGLVKRRVRNVGIAGNVMQVVSAKRNVMGGSISNSNVADNATGSSASEHAHAQPNKQVSQRGRQTVRQIFMYVDVQ